MNPELSGYKPQYTQQAHVAAVSQPSEYVQCIMTGEASSLARLLLYVDFRPWWAEYCWLCRGVEEQDQTPS